MSLFSDVVAVLERADIAQALIGAAAMAIHGVSRATADIDLFTVDEKSLQRELWTKLETKGATLRVLKGDFDDPLAGSCSPFRSRRQNRRLSLSVATVGRPRSSNPRSPYRWTKSP